MMCVISRNAIYLVFGLCRYLVLSPQVIYRSVGYIKLFVNILNYVQYQSSLTSLLHTLPNTLALAEPNTFLFPDHRPPYHNSRPTFLFLIQQHQQPFSASPASRLCVKKTPSIRLVETLHIIKSTCFFSIIPFPTINHFRIS